MKWFDDHLNLIKDLPQECIDDCSGPGAADEPVAYWVDHLEFEVPRQGAIDWLKDFGAWTLEEMVEMTDTELARTVLWLFCGDAHESKEQPYGLIH